MGLWHGIMGLLGESSGGGRESCSHFFAGFVRWKETILIEKCLFSPDTEKMCAGRSSSEPAGTGQPISQPT